MHKWSFVVLSVAALAVVSLGGAAAWAQIGPGEVVAADPNAIVVHEIVAAQGAADFWTAERLAAAKPLPLPTPVTNPVRAFDTAVQPGGPGGSFPSVGPTLRPTALDVDQVLTAFATEYPDFVAEAVREVSPQATDGYAYPAPFTRYPINANWQMHRYFPFTAIGKLFFQIPGEPGLWTCSGAVGNQRVVWTAGHCVYTAGRGWHTNMIFIPAYKNYGDIREPFGRFTVTAMTTLAGWRNDENNAYDIAIVRVADKDGRRLFEYTGHLGFQYNQATDRHFHAFGYPGNIVEGRFIFVCVGSTAMLDPLNGPDPIGIGCDMKHGSSGGPWLVNYRPYGSGNNNQINSVVSYGYNNQPLQFFGPYFGDGAKSLFDWGLAQN
jgi:V8-like Glu-specific endopeptidase